MRTVAYTLRHSLTTEAATTVKQAHFLFHPSCMGMTIEDAKKLEHFLCSDCSSDDDAKRPLNSFPLSPTVDAKVEPKRRKR